MGVELKKIVCFYVLLTFTITSYGQKDVTQFLDIPVDGYKPEMIKKLKSRGYTIKSQSEDILDGEFNGTQVNIFIGTNNNKVWRIGILDKYSTNETNIKIRFNNLIQQFVKNKRYSVQSDSIITTYTIPKDEDISYEMNINNKRYEAVFYQKSIKYDSLINEMAIQLSKDTLSTNDKSDKENHKIQNLISKTVEESLVSMNKQVWFMIKENYGNYRILIFYDNEYNKANGSSL